MIQAVTNENDFTKSLNFFLDVNEESGRLALYKNYAKEQGLTVAEAKDKILKEIFSNFIELSLKAALSKAQNKELTAFDIVSNLESLKPIFKDYDVNTFYSFISSVDSKLSLNDSELLFKDDFVSKDFVDSLTNNIIRSIAEPVTRPSNVDEYLISFNNHPLLYCLQESSTTDKVIADIDAGNIEVGQYKDLIKMVLDIKNGKNDEKIDFFISYLINQDINNGFYSILKDEGFKPSIVKDILLKVVQEEPLDDKYISNAINYISDLRMTIKPDAVGILNYSNSSAGTLNDSGFYANISGKNYFLHLHSAQGKGENQNGQQATTTTTLHNNNVDSISATLVKKNAGKDSHHKDFCSEFGLNFNELEKVVVSNLQFEANYLGFLSDTFEGNLNESKYLSQNIRYIKDSIQESVTYNKLHFGLNDLDIIKNKSQLYVNFLEKHKGSLSHLIEYSDSQNDTSYQVLAEPLLTTFKTLFNLEEKTGPLFTKGQKETISTFINDMKTSNSPQLNGLKKDLLRSMRLSVGEIDDNTKFNKFSDILSDNNFVNKGETLRSNNRLF